MFVKNKPYYLDEIKDVPDLVRSVVEKWTTDLEFIMIRGKSIDRDDMFRTCPMSFFRMTMAERATVQYLILKHWHYAHIFRALYRVEDYPYVKPPES